MKASETIRGGNLMDVVIRFLEDEAWHYQVIEPGALVRTGVRGERGTWICNLRVDEERRHVICHTLMDLNIPPENRAAVLEYLSRANFSLPLGGFDMNIDTGEIRFKNGLESPDGSLPVSVVRAMVLTALRATERYFPGVLSVVHSGLRPEAALARVETQAVTEE